MKFNKTTAKLLCSTAFAFTTILGCSKSEVSEDPVPTPPPTGGVTSPTTPTTPTTVSTTYDDINQSSLELDINHVFTATNGATTKAVTNSGNKAPFAVSFSKIREAHFNGLTPESVEARKTVDTHTILGQSKRLTGTDVEVVGIGRNDDGIGNVSVTFAFDRPDDDIPANGSITIEKAINLGQSSFGTPINSRNGYDSRDILTLGVEFKMNEGAICTTPNGTDLEVISFIHNSDFKQPENMFNFNDNGLSESGKSLSDVTEQFKVEQEFPVNIFVITTSTGKENIPTYKHNYNIGS